MVTLIATTADPLTPVPPARRGECPTLQRPMQTGDGLLARLRPIDNMLTLAQMRAIAQAASELGNGILEITARGSLQIRGLKPETVAPFESAVLDAGIRIATGTGIETPPLAGLDSDELIDVRPMAEALRARLANRQPALALAPKLAVTIDGGGRFHLGDVSADLKVTAFDDGGVIRFLLAVGGTAGTARPVAIAAGEDDVIQAILAVLEKLAAIGPTARGKQVDIPAIDKPPLVRPPPPLLGIHDGTTLGIAFSYRQAGAAELIALIDVAEQSGAKNMVLAPEHGLFLPGLMPGHPQKLQSDAAGLGFRTEPGDPRRNIALCAGSRGCASACFDTQAVAETLVALVPDLLDGSLRIHLSGCTKGCAHPSAADLTFVGARAGYGLVVNGAASMPQSAYIAADEWQIALVRLQTLVRQSKEGDETASACLARLGAGTVATALQMDRT